MKTRLLIIAGITVAISAAVGLSLVNDFTNTQNPNECWYQDDDGQIKPCVIGTGEWPISFSPWPEQNCDEICQESNAEHVEMVGISYGHQWILIIILMILILVGVSIGIIYGVKAWRKRK